MKNIIVTAAAVEYTLMAIGIILLLIMIWVIATGNRFRQLAVKIDESESGIDVSLTKRYDTLTKMLDVTKAYAKHEVETFERVINLRRGMSMAERQEANAEMDQMTARLNVVAENYPELRSAETFTSLQGAIRDAEAHLQAARRLYNSNVSTFNQMLVTFPASMIGQRQGQQAREFFEADAHKREDVKMNF